MVYKNLVRSLRKTYTYHIKEAGVSQDSLKNNTLSVLNSYCKDHFSEAADVLKIPLSEMSLTLGSIVVPKLMLK